MFRLAKKPVTPSSPSSHSTARNCQTTPVTQRGFFSTSNNHPTQQVKIQQKKLALQTANEHLKQMLSEGNKFQHVFPELEMAQDTNKLLRAQAASNLGLFVNPFSTPEDIKYDSLEKILETALENSEKLTQEVRSSLHHRK